jgi:hypothetical protein
MKTIEDCISEIESKAATIQSQLDLFQENIGYVGSVIGKDSTIVHSTLESRFCETMEIYRSTTRQNVEILEGYIGTLDKILQVLAEVLSVIESSKSAPVEDSLEARTSAETVLQQAADTAEKLSLDVETAIEKATGSTIQGDWFKMALIGGAVYVGLGLVGSGKLFQIAGAVAAAYYIGKR